jgi:hypothetical protein
MARAGCCAMTWLGSCLVAATALAQSPPDQVRGTTAEPAADTPYSVEKVRESLARDPVLVTSLEGLPVFRLQIVERWDRTFDLPRTFAIPSEPRAWSTSWHNEFLGMVTPEEARPYSPMFSSSDQLQLVGSGLVISGLAALATSAVEKWGESRRRGREAAAKREVDEALAAFEAGAPSPP